jgi:hypothetical protein
LLQSSKHNEVKLTDTSNRVQNATPFGAATVFGVTMLVTHQPAQAIPREWTWAMDKRGRAKIQVSF